jgi:flagellar capping protein FliD
MVTRIGGMASGMDTESMVKSLMDAERMPLMKLERQKQTLEWKQEDYRSMNSQLANLFKSAGDIRLESNFTGQSADKVVEKIKKFVETYNEVIGAVHGKLGEERYGDYQPLTVEQRDSMSDKQAERWDEKARSGMLKNDPILRGIMTEMRNEMTVPLAGASSSAFDVLAEIGISVKGSHKENGKLTLDEDKLRQVLATNPDQVKELFTKTGTTTADTGIAKRLYDTLNAGMKKISQKAGSTGSVPTGNLIGKEMIRLNTQMSNFNQRLVGVEDRYWKQFTAMEKAMSQMNSQSSWLYQQFS